MSPEEAETVREWDDSRRLRWCYLFPPLLLLLDCFFFRNGSNVGCMNGILWHLKKRCDKQKPTTVFGKVNWILVFLTFYDIIDYISSFFPDFFGSLNEKLLSSHLRRSSSRFYSYWMRNYMYIDNDADRSRARFGLCVTFNSKTSAEQQQRSSHCCLISRSFLSN